MNGAFLRSAALLGEDRLRRLRAAHVLIVGIGGVGSWCAEALVRTGVGAITLVDDDVVVDSNINRQCPAMPGTLGRPKVEAMRERLLSIAPDARVTAVSARYPEGFEPDWADFAAAVDAIDSVPAKAELILSATSAGVPLVSSMGAARRTDPTRVKVCRFEKVTGDGLARALRRRFRLLQRFPAAHFDCVCSGELPVCAELGSIMPVTCAFGMALASRVIARV